MLVPQFAEPLLQHGCRRLPSAAYDQFYSFGMDLGRDRDLISEVPLSESFSPLASESGQDADLATPGSNFESK